MPRGTGGQENIKVTHILGKRGGKMFEPRDCERMSYNLAKSLKDAGFANKELGRLLGLSEEDKIGVIQGVSLSALIEACGVWDGFALTTKKTIGSDVWTARVRKKCMDRPYGRGRTPKEAVAKLWLDLNKK